MSLKAELETWAAALKAYDEEDFNLSLELFSRIADSSKILTNMGLIYATLGEHEEAVRHFNEATSLDQYLAVAYFQCGVSNFLLGKFDLALNDFDETIRYLRGNQTINYEQIGLKFRLYSAEVLFNKGLCLINMDNLDEGLALMREARSEKATDEHNVIDEALVDQGQGYTVFSIPVGVLYRPSEKKLKNAVQKDYMGKARLIASSDPNDDITTFTGSARLKMGITPTGVFVDSRPVDTPPAANVTRSATVPAALPQSRPAEGVRSAGLARAQTTLNVPANARELTSPGSLRSAPRSAGPAIGRSNTQITPARASPNAQLGPARGLSIRRPTDGSPAPPPPAKSERMTDFYDDYLDSYTGGAGAPPVPQLAPAPNTVAAWQARQNQAPQSYAPSRSGSYAGSSFGGGSMRRKPTRSRTMRSRVNSRYEEEEEGYGSGEYDDGPLEMTLIRVKLHYNDETRGMTLNPDTPFEEFVEKITMKFGKSPMGLGMKFKDEDGGMVTLRDESDFEMAIETARFHAKGRPEGKLEIWCTDLAGARI